MGDRAGPALPAPAAEAANSPGHPEVGSPGPGQGGGTGKPVDPAPGPVGGDAVAGGSAASACPVAFVSRPAQRGNVRSGIRSHRGGAVLHRPHEMSEGPHGTPSRDSDQAPGPAQPEPRRPLA